MKEWSIFYMYMMALILCSGIVASPFSVNHALPDFYYGVHRYLFKHYPQWMQVQSFSMKMVFSVLSYFADASRPILGNF